MLWSKLFIPTLREVPAEAEVASHQLLLRAGYIRQLSAGIYSYLFLTQRSLLKIQQIVREEMDRMGAQEMLLPALCPAEVWQESGRWDMMGDNMFRLKDRFQRDLCLGMTHEEVMTTIARGELRSYRQLPQIWYQIQTKFRDEPRPKSGLLRVRQFIMKDSYSFDLDQAGLDAAYEQHYKTYCRIFDRCGLEYTVVEAHSGAMGGSQSQEFVVASDAGEDLVAICKGCGYSANLAKAAPPRACARCSRAPISTAYRSASPAGRAPRASRCARSSPSTAPSFRKSARLTSASNTFRTLHHRPPWTRRAPAANSDKWRPESEFYYRQAPILNESTSSEGYYTGRGNGWYG